ncbi:uncharacterized protein LOC127279209 [Leptopilina boulardi]|uniref:uncharacterized protein LOC127279209 n=1 Tax=Leptopilina boulardi TaxID=63433 RepID=UPI0021F61FDC|nr:uncharacterized protein LOC127279209 [Leptopilina boulardi]
MSVDENKTYTFKLYVYKNQKEDEIRKFGLKTNELSFEKMVETLEAIFPLNQFNKFTLLWKDKESDMITLSSSKEFSIFEEHVIKSTDQEIKLYINIEDELYSISKKFDNCGLKVNYTCKTCQKTIIPKCTDCFKQNLPQERKILNIVDQSLSNINRTDDKNEPKAINTLSTIKPINNQKGSDSPAFSFGSSVNFPSNSDFKKTPVSFGSPGVSTNLFK